MVNIFAVDERPEVCARWLDDARLRKMIVETAQMLSTATWLWGWKVEDVYKPTHKGHPCTLWVADSLYNFSVAHYLLECYLEEFEWRFGKRHKTADVWLVLVEYVGFGEWFDKPRLVDTPNVTPYADWEVHEAYKQALRDKWAQDKNPKWTGRE